MSPVYAHQIFSDSDCIFEMAAILVIFLICYTAYVDSHRDFISHILKYLLFNYTHKRNNATVTYFLIFMSIFLKIHILLTSEASCALTYDRPTKTKLCTVS